MEGRELAARSDGSSAVRNDEEDSAEMHEDADFTDLPVHFQPIEADGNAPHNGPSRTPISEFVVEKHRALMDADSPYLDPGISLTPNYTSPPPTEYTSPPPITYPHSSSSTYTSPHSSSYTSPPPSSTMDMGYTPLSAQSVYSAQNLGGHNNGMGAPLGYGSSYHGITHSAAINTSGMYGTSGMNNHYDPENNNAVAGPSGKNGHPGDAYQPVTPVHPSGNGTTEAGSESEFALYGRSGNRLCSAGVNTVESGSGLNRQVSTECSGGGQGGGERQAGSAATGEQSSIKPFQCPECEASFTRVDHLNRHLRTQSSHFHTVNDKQYHPCPHCSKLFTRRDHMKRHLKIHIRGEPVKCVECQTWFPSKMDLTHHLLEAHHVLVFECNVCSKGFFEAKYLTEHLKNRHDMIDGADGRLVQSPKSKQPPSPHAMQLPYRCGICSLSFVHESACNKHMMSHTKRLTSSPASSLSLASSHLTEVRDAAVMSQLWAQAALSSTDEGGNNGTNAAMQAFSQGLHHSAADKGNLCFANGMSPGFPHTQSLHHSQMLKSEPGDSDHQHHHHGKQRGKGGGFGDANGHLANLFLNKSFPQPDVALRMMQCGGNDSFLCGVCGKGFDRAQELKVHLRRHSGHHRFACMECGASFASSSNLVRHQRTHSGEKPFKCSLCTSAFTHKGALINHERIHTGERPYVCDLCDAAFARVDALTRHKRTHKENRIKQEEDEDSEEGMFGLRA